MAGSEQSAYVHTPYKGDLTVVVGDDLVVLYGISCSRGINMSVQRAL